ncbi:MULTISPECIES: hypothetical protein [Streptomyces]|uniref:Molecular chaperone DnaJ n=1 Tax=Streptomyces doudnae TaxID=3075536 RepID=A0ABD5ERR1_9ACTN|nr:MULTISPECIES: hypothetical protein [unclassified Streptomyces]MDT0436917.1 hypothetical protein [Streptomyces sp. DSM 41981]MYQ63053.1 hypothetical protein [Streptomyces sp. SID4950]SCD49872.1 hypothetical protein GA0115242_10662 [Streptomyces sp. SolWspMP-5a-2]
MPRNDSRPRTCRDCDGHASAKVTTGQRDRDGSRQTLTVTCPVCKGTGTSRRVTHPTHTGR